MADTIFLAQILSIGGFALWQAGYVSDWAGFAVIGGSIAGMLGVFAFTAFGALSCFGGAAQFWRTLHPANFGLAMLFGAGYTAMFYGQWAAQAAAAACGLCAAMACARFLPNRPRAWLALCLILLMSRYALPWRYSGIAAAGLAPFILTLWSRNLGK
ncbi:MAG: hypothetical protein ACR2P5_08515 [Gammaproteobacteria bacterium]